jgi:HAMP domain-containing protein
MITPSEVTAASPKPISAPSAKKTRTISLVVRVLFAVIIAGLLPLVGVTVSALNGYRVAEDQAVSTTSATLDEASLVALQQRSQQTATDIGHFLDARAADARAVALLPPDPSAYTRFAAAHTSELWYAAGTASAPTEVRQQFPLFREIVALDASGRPVAHVVDDVAQGVTAADTAQFAPYFSDAKALAPDALSVSHLSRLYVPRTPAEVAATRPLGADYATFDGVYRFVVARRTASGTFDGAVMIALDARHVMEFVIHINPTQVNRYAVWPDYDSGNYAYMFDDQGWTIAHPRLWTVRGDDAAGNPIPAVTAAMTPAERDSHPFNAPLGGWADPNLPNVFAKGVAGQSGFVIIINQQEVRKATTYSPVPFNEGGYNGAFGVLAIGANTVEFHRSATTVATGIEKQRDRLQLQLSIVAIAALALLGLAGVVISRTLVHPLSQLATVARQLERGEFNAKLLNAVRNRRFSDEVSVLAERFEEMGKQVVKRETQLRTEIAQLHIQIDSRRRQQQVDEITDTDYFRNLRNTANRMRSRAPGQPTETPPADDASPANNSAPPRPEGETP